MTTPATPTAAVLRRGTADAESFQAQTTGFEGRTVTARSSVVVLASGRRVTVPHGADFGGLIRASKTS